MICLKQVGLKKEIKSYIKPEVFYLCRLFREVILNYYALKCAMKYCHGIYIYGFIS